MFDTDYHVKTVIDQTTIYSTEKKMVKKLELIQDCEPKLISFFVLPNSPLGLFIYLDWGRSRLNERQFLINRLKFELKIEEK